MATFDYERKMLLGKIDGVLLAGKWIWTLAARGDRALRKA